MPSMSHRTASGPGSAPMFARELRSAGIEVLRLRVVGDHRVGGLLRVQLQLLGQASRRSRSGLQQVDDLHAVVEVGAGAVAERVAGTPVAQVEELLDVGRVLGRHGRALGEAQLLADPPVPELGERLGELHAEAVHLQVVAVGVLGEQLVRVVGDRLAHRHEVQRQHVHLAALDGQLARPPEVGQAQVPVAALAGEREPVALRRVGLRLVEDHAARRPRRRPGSTRRRRRRAPARPRWTAAPASSAAADGPRSRPAPRTTGRSRRGRRAAPTGPGTGRARRPCPRSRPPRRP